MTTNNSLAVGFLIQGKIAPNLFGFIVKEIFDNEYKIYYINDPTRKTAILSKIAILYNYKIL
tara:strand:- start:504 stop:689 length:186 start_codon:yes stop_codon:yes gene_type:complete